MKNIKFRSSQIEGLESLFNFLDIKLKNRPEFDITVLKKLKFWPITPGHYHSFTIKKRNGSERELVSVNKNLKAMQSNLAGTYEPLRKRASHS